MIKTKEEIEAAPLKFLIENSLNMYEGLGGIILSHSSGDFYLNLSGSSLLNGE